MKKLVYLLGFTFLFLTSYSCNEQDQIESLESFDLKSSIEKRESLPFDDGCETAFAYCSNYSKCFLDLDLGFNR